MPRFIKCHAEGAELVKLGVLAGMREIAARVFGRIEYTLREANRMILPGHTAWYSEIFRLPGLLADPVLVFGFQDVWKPPEIPDSASEFFAYPDLNGWLRAQGFREVVTLDHFDPRADRLYDMNLPVPESEHGRYGTLIDIGCLEHVFDTRQCLENCLRMVRRGGHYFLHTPVKGYYGHGLHTFHPEALLSALELNGFEIVYLRYTGMDGVGGAPEELSDALIWVAAHKVAEIERFTCPQQGRWSTRYKDL